MLKRKSIVSLCAMLATIFMLFAATKVMAGECPVQTSCTLVDAKGNTTSYSITFQGETKDPNSSNWIWTYTLSSNFPGGQNQLAMLASVCCPVLGYQTVGGGQVLPPGAGDTTTGFGVGTFQNNVLRVATSYPLTYQISTNSQTSYVNTSMQIKSGKDLYSCQNIAGPSCADWAQEAVASYKEVVTKSGVKFCLVSDPFSECDKAVDCTTGADLPWKDIKEILKVQKDTEPSADVTSVSSPGQHCVTVVIEDNAEHSTHYCSGGRCYY
jgi:hypothetical protein